MANPIPPVKSEKWLQAGYELFAREGVEGIQVERLARILDLNKSGFYHYFGDVNKFIEDLFTHHKKITTKLAAEISSCEKFDPEFLICVVKYKLCILFHVQLLRKTNHSIYNSIYKQSKEILDTAIQPRWAKYIGWEHDPKTAMQYFDLIRNSFYASANFQNITYINLHRLMMETKGTASKLFVNNVFVRGGV